MEKSKRTPEERKHRRKKITRIILVSIIGLLIIFRLMLPYIVLKYVNKTLANIKEYYGHVDDIDIALIRGAYVIKDIRIEKVDSAGVHDSIPFFTSPVIDLSVQWKAIFKGRVVGEIYVEDPVLNFVKGKHKNEDVKADTADFTKVIKDLMPLTVNHFEISNGQIHYMDKYSSPKLDISMKDINAVATNLSNVNDSAKLLPASLKATANAYEGKIDLNVNFDALQKAPTFDMNASVKNVNMVLLNDFWRAYGNFDLKKGNFGLYTEFAGKDGKFNGYVKPVLKDLDIVQWNKEEGNVGQILWETLVAGVAEILKNHKKEQLATKVPIEGRFDSPSVNLWDAISYVLRNAFIQALKPSIDNTININEVNDTESHKTFLQKIFGKKDKDAKSDDKEKSNKKEKKKKDKK